MLSRSTTSVLPRLAAPAAKSCRALSSLLVGDGSAESVVTAARDAGVEFVSFRFTDLHGRVHHMTQPMHELDEGVFESGVPFDGSSLRGWEPIHKSDMVMLPDAATAALDPFVEASTLMLTCNIHDPNADMAAYGKDPRGVARRMEERLAGLADLGVADSHIGPEMEFFLFDNVSFEDSPHRSSFSVDAAEAPWRRSSPHDGHNLVHKGGYTPVAPHDRSVDIRNDMMSLCMELGLHVECAHHEVGVAQHELDFRFGRLVESADRVQTLKYVVRNVASRSGLAATFMPKPMFGDNGSGMHHHYDLRGPDGSNLFTGDGPAGLSDMALHFVGGVLKHASALLAFTNPATNSYKRLVEGYEAPVFCAYSSSNRSAAIRVPSSHPKARRIELRVPDPLCNPYLAFPAVLQAGLDGVRNKIHPGEERKDNLYELSAEEAAKIQRVPSSLKAALNALESDHDFLLEGGVFTPELIETWLEEKRVEVDADALRPTPVEYAMYFDA